MSSFGIFRSAFLYSSFINNRTHPASLILSDFLFFVSRFGYAFARAFFKRELVFLVAGGIILGFYNFFFALLQLEDLTLLVGTLGLFVLLAVAMYFTGSIQGLESDRNSK